MALRSLGLVVVAAVATGCAPERPPLHSPAYVQDVRADRATVCEISRGPDARTLEHWADADPTWLLGRQVDGARCVDHAFVLDGLQPDTRYRYALRGSLGAVVHEGTFRTAPLPGARTVRFLAVSDTGHDEVRYPDLHAFDEVVQAFGDDGGEGSATAELFAQGRRSPPRPQARVAEAMRVTTPDADFILHGGDVVGPERHRGDYGPSFFEPFGPLIDHVPVFAVPGNHDVGTAGGTAWDEVFRTPADDAGRRRRYYSLEWGDVHVTALDYFGTPFDPGSPQRAFLEEDLALASRAAWRIVLLHSPVLSEGKGDNLQLVNELQPILERARVQLVLSGHEHVYQRFRPVRGVTFVVMGSGGQWHPRHAGPAERLATAVSGYSFLRGTADATTLVLEAFDSAGNRFDAVTLER